MSGAPLEDEVARLLGEASRSPSWRGPSPRAAQARWAASAGVIRNNRRPVRLAALGIANLALVAALGLAAAGTARPDSANPMIGWVTGVVGALHRPGPTPPTPAPAASSAADPHGAGAGSAPRPPGGQKGAASPAPTKIRRVLQPAPRPLAPGAERHGR